MNIENLSNFLKIAKKNTYASEKAERAISQRPGSKDYEYAEGEFLYHDTYFGGKRFIGEEIFKNGKLIYYAIFHGGLIS